MDSVSFREDSPLMQEQVLLSNEVHIWRASLDRMLYPVTLLREVLDANELQQAERFCFKRDRSRYIISRGLLRHLLGNYLSLLPQNVRFRYNSHGKPYLMQTGVNGTLFFNVSHSYMVVLYALAYNRELGIDVEYINQDIDHRKIAHRFFSPLEIEMLMEDSSRSSFFSCWTRKEAYLKAKGTGLGFPLDKFAVSCLPHMPARLLKHDIDPEELNRWSIQSIDIGTGYVAAIAVKGHGWRLKQGELESIIAYNKN